MSAADFEIALVFPPQGHFTQPYLALPCIQAWLRTHGFARTHLYDANIEAYDALLSRRGLERARDRVRERLPLSRYAGRGELPFAELEGFRAAAESAVSADGLVASVDDAKQVLRGARFWDVEQYLPAVRTLYQSLRLVSAAHFPSQLTPHNFTTARGIDRSEAVLDALADERALPFWDYYIEDLLPRLVAQRPKLLGLSIIYGSQLVPGLALARLVKRALPDCHVTAGGGFLAYIGAKLMNARDASGAPAFAGVLDSIVFHEGEAPMLALARALDAGEALGTIGSLTWFERTGGTPCAVANPPGHPIRLDGAPVPDFDGLPLDKYFSPELVIPYDVNRGCYYGECTFCTLPTVIGPGYRTRRAATIAEQVVELTHKHGTHHVNFITDCMPPGMLSDLPDELIARDAGITWWADARVEPRSYTLEGARKLYASGCRKLLFGFETATPRLLKLMQKGQSLRATLEVADNCAQAGISVTFYAMVGFPTETREEARATLDVLLANKHAVREVSLQTFHIDEIAETYHRPEAFGIQVLPADGDLSLYHDYTAASGMTQGEAAAMFEEIMAALRREFPLFSGDHIHFFMQKSHYFLHLARGTTPDQFAAACAQRTRAKLALGARDDLRVRDGLVTVELAHSWAEAVRRLGTSAARAIRPDFLTGRYVDGAREQAERELGALPQVRKLLAWAPGLFEHVELAPDAAALLGELARAGSLGALQQRVSTETGRARVAEFAARLHRAGLLVPSRAEGAPSPSARPADAVLVH
ncbi:MAG: radical SAM protein [Planctomycetota bacterium]|nr:MAG: radical SAM protein [Planctomycetota bacterium]